MSLGDLAQLLRISLGVAHHIDRNVRHASSAFQLKKVIIFPKNCF